MKFKELAVWDDFTMDGTSFDKGRNYIKISPRMYQERNDKGYFMEPVYKVGTVNVEVNKKFDK